MAGRHHNRQPFIPLGAASGAIGYASSPTRDVLLPAKLGVLSTDWHGTSQPSPPSSVTGPWVLVTKSPLPSVDYPHRTSGAGTGIIFDPRTPSMLGSATTVWYVYSGAEWGYNALIRVPHVVRNLDWPDQPWPSYEQDRPWIAGSFSASKPSNAANEWIEITHAPGAGPKINGKPTEQGRGTLHRDDGSSEFVVVYNVKQDHPSGWLVQVGVYEDMAMPQCSSPSQAVYSRAANGMWPPGHPQQYLCGIPIGDKDGLDLFRLPAPTPNPGGGSLPPPPNGSGQPGPSGSSAFSGVMVKEPTGQWLPATFFATPPPRHIIHFGPQTWVQIKTPPGYKGARLGHGILHRGDKSKSVLLLEIGGTQQRPRARFVPNDDPFFANKPEPPGDAPTPTGPVGDSGFAPFSVAQPLTPPRLRAKRPIMSMLRRGW